MLLSPECSRPHCEQSQGLTNHDSPAIQRCLPPCVILWDEPPPEVALRRMVNATLAVVMSPVPIKRIIQPEEVAELVRFVASPGAAAITGQTFNICGGQTMD